MPSEMEESNSGTTSIDPMSSWESNVTADYSQTDDQNELLLTQPSNSRPTTLNTAGAQKDMYWFAHAADPPQEKPKRNVKSESSSEQDDVSSVKRGDGEKESPTDTSSCKGRGVLTSSQFESKEDASPQSHKDRDERMRHFKERVEEDRTRRLQELELASAHAQRIRDLQEEERKRKIEELRIKDIERRHAVEERKRQIWEAEQERKEAILRRNLDREAKIEARRNAQRNSISFAFGSSTPRTIDLEPGYVHYYRTVGNVAANGRCSEERDVEYYKRRPPSADILDGRQDRSLASFPRDFDELVLQMNSVDLEMAKEIVKQPYRKSGMNSDDTRACLTMTDNSFDPYPLWGKQLPGFFNQSGLGVGEDLMTRSMVSLSASATRGRRRTDITPTLKSHRDLSLSSNSPGNSIVGGNSSNQTKRAVSMSRLDLLSQPRRRTIDSSSAAASHDPTTSMSKSMFNLENSPRRVAKRGVGSDRDVGGGSMSRSMMHLAPIPIPPPRSTNRSNARVRPRSVPLSQSGKQLSKSMMHLTPPPRPNRATQLRALAAARRDGTDLVTSEVNQVGSNGPHVMAVTGTAKEVSDSPSRPRSSMSLASEKSATSSHQSTVSMRMRTVARRPRPVSIAGTVPDNAVTPPQPPPRQSRTSERKAPPVNTQPTRPSRTKSAGPVNEAETQSKPPSVPKPVAKPPSPASDKTEVKSAEVQNGNQPAPPLAEDGDADQQQKGSPNNKPRINSEEAAKAALAEKRRLAREQAEREAELERQRQEKLRQEEEEKKRQEEEEQKKMEEEHARLVEALRQQEELKLKKAIEEQEKLELEQRLLREEEARQKAERDEQERKAKEEAEKQRKELEEKLIKEEAERAERKKRVEQIMKRTRGKGSNQNGNGSQDSGGKGEDGVDGERNSAAEESDYKEGAEDADEKNITESHPLHDNEESVDGDLGKEAAEHAATVNYKNDLNAMLNQEQLQQPNNNSAGSVIAQSVAAMTELSDSDPFGSLTMPQTNGFATQDTHFKQHHVNPDEKLNPSVDDLLDFDPLSSNSNEKMNTSPDFGGLVDFGSAANNTATNNQNEMFANNNDDINSNRMAANPFISFEENANMKQESATVADLLS